MNLPQLLLFKEALLDGGFEFKQPMRYLEDLAEAIAKEIKR
jgi:hypothetical protein